MRTVKNLNSKNISKLFLIYKINEDLYDLTGKIDNIFIISYFVKINLKFSTVPKVHTDSTAQSTAQMKINDVSKMRNKPASRIFPFFHNTTGGKKSENVEKSTDSLISGPKACQKDQVMWWDEVYSQPGRSNITDKKKTP